MKKEDIKRIALLVAEELKKEQDKMLNEDELIIRLCCTRRSLYRKAKEGVPLRKKKGIVGYYAFESDLYKYFKNQN